MAFSIITILETGYRKKPIVESDDFVNHLFSSGTCGFTMAYHQLELSFFKPFSPRSASANAFFLDRKALAR
jgi:hypothetical protein